MEELALNLAGRAESLPVTQCRYCGADIVWTESKKTGKRYPATVVRTPSESATRMENVRFAPWNPHTREACKQSLRRSQEGIAQRRRDAAVDALITGPLEIALGDPHGREDRNAIIAAIEAVKAGEVMV